MQKVAVFSTLLNSTLLRKIAGYNPITDYKKGIKKFILWHLSYYTKNKIKIKFFSSINNVESWKNFLFFSLK